jgi:hypothetical protein
MATPLASRLMLAIGLVALALVVLNQVTAPRIDPPLERAAVLASLLAVVLMLVAALWQRIQPAAALRADLVGREGLELAADLPESLRRELAWGSRMLLTATPAAVVLVQAGNHSLLRRGLLADTPFGLGPICQQSLERQKAISLVDLSLYPGRVEFEPLLANLPSVVVQPVGQEAVLVLGGWSPRCFTQADLAWIGGWAEKLIDAGVPAWAAEVRGAGASAAEAPETR